MTEKLIPKVVKFPGEADQLANYLRIMAFSDPETLAKALLANCLSVRGVIRATFWKMFRATGFANARRLWATRPALADWWGRLEVTSPVCRSPEEALRLLAKQGMWADNRLYMISLDGDLRPLAIDVLAESFCNIRDLGEVSVIDRASNVAVGAVVFVITGYAPDYKSPYTLDRIERLERLLEEYDVICLFFVSSQGGEINGINLASIKAASYINRGIRGWSYIENVNSTIS